MHSIIYAAFKRPGAIIFMIMIMELGRGMLVTQLLQQISSGIIHKSGHLHGLVINLQY